MAGDKVRQSIEREYRAARAEFHRILASLTPEELARRSLNPGWTNGQLLFHITLGFLLIPSLALLVRLFSHLPRGISRAYAALLDFGTPLFNWINGLGPRGAARIFHGARLEAKFDKSIDAALRIAASIHGSDWQRSMAYPSRWDPLIDSGMTLEGLFHYMVRHMQFHLTQLSAGAR